jgi:hypoxanthine phosphoribosyltransferase
MRVSSYGASIRSSGRIKIVMDLDISIKGKDIIIIEDIIDSGFTINYLIKELNKRKPRRMKICTLLDKKARRIIPIKIDYCGFVVPDKFVVGYGIDYNEQYRQLSYIGYIR